MLLTVVIPKAQEDVIAAQMAAVNAERAAYNAQKGVVPVPLFASTAAYALYLAEQLFAGVVQEVAGKEKATILKQLEAKSLEELKALK